MKEPCPVRRIGKSVDVLDPASSGLEILAGAHDAMPASGDDCTRRPPYPEGPPGVRKESSSCVTAFAEDLAHRPGGGGNESATGVEARVSSGGRVDRKEGLDAVEEIEPHGSVGARMDELYELLWERISRVYEYDQVHAPPYVGFATVIPEARVVRVRSVFPRLMPAPCARECRMEIAGRGRRVKVELPKCGAPNERTSNPNDVDLDTHPDNM